MPHTKLALPAALLLTLLLAVACGDDDGATSSPTPSDTGATPVATEPDGDLGPNGISLGRAPAGFTLETSDEADLAPVASGLAVGDFNGDGRPDLAVGVSQGDGPDNDRADTGEVYVLFDTTELSDTTVLSSETAGLTIYGVEGEEFHGFQVAAGDLNGDGTDDLVLTAPGITAGADLRTDQGRVYVFFGGPELTGVIDLADGDEPWGFVLTGAEGFSRAGHSIDIGDVNGDGIDDLVVGAPFAGREPGSPPGGPRTGAGALYVVYGHAGLSGEVNIAFDDPGFWVTNEEEFSQFAISVAVGDLNGDGVDDMAVGAPQLSTELGAASGSVFVFYGGPSLNRIVTSSEADVIVRAADADDALGFRVAVLPVENSPSRLVASATRADGPDNSRSAAGDVYILDVSNPGIVELSESDPVGVIFGSAAGMALGQEISIGDLDGDGAPDIVLSAPSATSRGGALPVAGMTLVVFGPDVSGVVDSSGGDGFIWYEGHEAEGQSGSPLLIADVRGDGRNLLLIGASRSGSSGARPGQIRAITVER